MLLSLLACTGPSQDTAGASPDPSADGAWSVGHRSAVLPDAERPLTVEVWYPTQAAPSTVSVPEAFLSGAQQQDYAALLAAADPDCPTQTVRAAGGAEAAEGPWPAVVFSHCHSCTRFSSLTMAQRLASHGVVVVAPDHAGNTLLDALQGESLSLSAATLALRRDDGVRALDALLAGELGDLSIDPSAIGAVGHSFGSVTAGLIAQTDDRIIAAMGVAAPMENPLLPGVEIAALDVPLMLVVAQEDNSITEAGNLLIRNNFAAAVGPAWKAEVADAGHWSFSDLCGLIADFQPGCGQDERQTAPGETFTYLPAAQGRATISTLATAFFLQTLTGQDALAGLEVDGVSLESR